MILLVAKPQWQHQVIPSLYIRRPLPTARGSAPEKRGQEMEQEDQEMKGNAKRGTPAFWELGELGSCSGDLAYLSLTAFIAMLLQAGEGYLFGRFESSEAAVWS